MISEAEHPSSGRRGASVASLFLLATLIANAHVAAADIQPSRNFFERTFSGSRVDFTGHVGYEFTAEATFTVTALGRSVSGEALRHPHTVTIWSVADKRKLASVTITPKSLTDTCGFAYGVLPQRVKLEGGRTYRITSSEEKGGDPMVDIGALGAHIGVATVQSGIYAENDAFPTSTYGSEEQGYGVPTFFVDPAGLDASLLKAATSGAKPFIRDVVTGYLLNYNFLSPRPYCWPGDDALLSGWDVDKSGGRWECQPNCRYPQGFAFHSDWFKIVDTSNTAAVTLKHQIARQTQGQLVWEFRFKMPALMDGVCWQLRDLQDAAVSLVMAGGNLCVESPDGKNVPLQPCEAGKDYGIKVVADLGAKTADIHVDGEIKTKAVRFRNPVESIDFVLVKTGDAPTGDLFLGPVNVHKGYSVCDTFVTAAVGELPAEWTAEGAASVESFECATRPDIFSLKLNGSKEKSASVRRSFSAISGKTVFECRLLLPEKQDGASLELTDGGKPSLRVATADGNLCLIDRGGKPIVLAREYRANFWYMLKAVADPKSGATDFFVNGKRVAEKVSCAAVGNAFDGLRVTSSASCWIDDVLVYAWQDYPADYVPEPKPCPARDGYLLGVQSCNLWNEGNSYAGWDYVYRQRAKRKPLLGWYDEGNPEVADWEIKWQVEHGIGFELHCWYRPNNAINRPIKDGVLDQGIIKGLFNARYGHLKKFAIMCTDEGACETNPDDFRQNIVPYWIEYFFKDPRYLKIDGKPVLSIYHLGHLQRMLGGADGCRKAIQMLREEVAKAGFPGLILLMELRNADRNAMKTMKSIGVDYGYAYTWGTPDVNVQRRNNLAQRDAAAAEKFGLLPSISMGWDRESWGVHDGGWVPVDDYRTLLKWARDELMPSHPADSLGRRIVMLPNWNEFGEGHFLMPSALAGFGYVDALREVFTAGGAHKDEAPTDRQKHRFTTLYPKE